MAEQREEWCTILLKFSSKPTVKIALFDSRQWVGNLGDAWASRVRRGSIHSGKWVPEDQGSLIFYSLADVASLVLSELEGTRNPLETLPEPPHPLLRNKSRCRWKKAGTEGYPTGVQTWASCDPVRSYSGLWVIYLAGGVGWVPCTEVTPLDHFGREVPRG
ncbi:MAG: hypothetical protein CVU73_15815 [Deltaproteobacteria bacterium HGW-Deltaproteobacteria-8]|jgi:hypothetical protein|nr:MAG: hypothetical protein CVU73_15815 [Deltaproteobacteria bacterium HGW-Deltaproteobacteria-8]